MAADSGRSRPGPTRRGLDEDLRREHYRIGSAQRAVLRASALAVDLAIQSGSSEAITRAGRGHLEQLRAAGLSVDDGGGAGERGGASGSGASAAGDDAFMALLREFTTPSMGDPADVEPADDGPGVGAGR